MNKSDFFEWLCGCGQSGRVAVMAMVFLVGFSMTGTASSVQIVDRPVVEILDLSVKGQDSTLTAEHQARSSMLSRSENLPLEQAMSHEAEQRLATTIVKDFVFDEVPFYEVILELKAKYDFNVIVDHSAYEDSLPEDQLVSANLDGVSLETALEILLSRNNGDFTVKSGMIQVYSRDVEGDPEYFQTRIFDYAGLSGKLPKTLPRPEPTKAAEDNVPVVNGLGGGKLSGSGAFAIQDQATIDGKETVQDVEIGIVEKKDAYVPTTLELLVMEQVVPDGWAVSGTGEATLHEVNGKLIVCGSGRQLRETRRLLEYLESQFVTGADK